VRPKTPYFAAREPVVRMSTSLFGALPPVRAGRDLRDADERPQQIE
jgi:hypothetical protein